jgi:septal ring factor EnvC (AmiA/AmiB activator)
VFFLVAKQLDIMDAVADAVEDRSAAANAFSQLKSDISSMREHLSQMQKLLDKLANQVASEEAQRLLADAQRDHQLRVLMTGIHTSIQAFLTQQEVDMAMRTHMNFGHDVPSDGDSENS